MDIHILNGEIMYLSDLIFIKYYLKIFVIMFVEKLKVITLKVV